MTVLCFEGGERISGRRAPAYSLPKTPPESKSFRWSEATEKSIFHTDYECFTKTYHWYPPDFSAGWWISRTLAEEIY